MKQPAGAETAETRRPFIIEGPDASGKTSLAHAIIERFGGRYIHLTLTDRLIEAQWDALAQAAASPGITIIDRHWVSEQVYGAVYRGDVLTNLHAPLQINLFEQLNGVYIFCVPRPDKAFLFHQEMVAKREEMYESDERILQVAHAYHQFLYGTTDAETAFKDVDCLGRRIARNGGWLTQEPSYVYDRSKDETLEWIDRHQSLFA